MREIRSIGKRLKSDFMDLLTLVIGIVIMGVTIQLGESWMVFGIALILIIASKSIKIAIFLMISLAVLYYTNGIGMKDYWYFAAFGLIILAYLLGLGKEEAPADPYAGLLGGMGGMGM